MSTSYYRRHGVLYEEDFGSDNLEYPGYDDSWVLGVQKPGNPLPLPARHYSSRGAFGSSYRNYGGYSYGDYNNYSRSYGSHYPSRSSYGSGYGYGYGAHEYRHHPQPSLLQQIFPHKSHLHSSSRMDYPDEVKLKVTICCIDCKNKLSVALRDMRGVYDVRFEGSPHSMVTVTGRDLKAKKILKKARKIFKNADYWSDWHFSDGVAPHRSSNFLGHSYYAPSPIVGRITY